MKITNIKTAILATAMWAGAKAKFLLRMEEAKTASQMGQFFSKRHKPERGRNLGSGNPCHVRKAEQMCRAHIRRLGKNFPFNNWRQAN